MATIYNRIRNGMTNATEGDVTHLDTDFISGAGVGDLTYDGIVTQNTGSDRNILVTGGIFYVKNSAAYTRSQSVQKYRSYEVHDATVTVAVSPNTTLATRIDYLCLKDDTAATPDANASNTGSFVVVAGTVNNTAPAIPDNHLVLARLDLPQNFTGITNAMITDMRVVATIANKDGWTLIDESEDPLAVGGTLAIVQYVSATSLKIYGDWTKFIGKYTKLKLKNTTDKYFLITDDGSFAASYTTYTITGGGTYTLTNTEITKVYYSQLANPVGFPDVLNSLRDDSATSYGMARQAMINGNFDVWQRGVSLALSDATLSYQADRWANFPSDDGGTLPTLTISRQVLTSGDIANAIFFHRTATNGAGTSLGANSVYLFFQKIENGTRNLCGASKKVTISFWARSSIASKKIGIRLRQNYGSGGSPTSEETITGTNWTLTSTWAKYSYTFTTNTLVGKTFGTDYNDNLRIEFLYQWGSSIATTVGAGSAETYVGSGNIDIAQVTACAGDVALPFQPKSFEEELRSCSRYFEKSYNYASYGGASTASGSIFFNVGTNTTNNLALTAIFSVRKRTTPTITIYDVAGNLSKVYKSGGNNRNFTSPWSGETAFYIQSNDATSGADLGFHYLADAEI